jgi:hypothetical protein
VLVAKQRQQERAKETAETLCCGMCFAPTVVLVFSEKLQLRLIERMNELRECTTSACVAESTGAREVRLAFRQ